MAGKEKNINLDLDVSSFSDIAFLLIIFFILTTSFSRPLGRIIDIPSASKPEEQKADDDYPTVTILSDRLMLGKGEDKGKELTMTELRADLMRRGLHAASTNDRMLVVNMGEDVTYEKYFRVVTLISEAGGIVAMMTD